MNYVFEIDTVRFKNDQDFSLEKKDEERAEQVLLNLFKPLREKKFCVFNAKETDFTHPRLHIDQAQINNFSSRACELVAIVITNRDLRTVKIIGWISKKKLIAFSGKSLNCELLPLNPPIETNKVHLHIPTEGEFSKDVFESYIKECRPETILGMIRKRMYALETSLKWIRQKGDPKFASDFNIKTEILKNGMCCEENASFWIVLSLFKLQNSSAAIGWWERAELALLHARLCILSEEELEKHVDSFLEFSMSSIEKLDFAKLDIFDSEEKTNMFDIIDNVYKMNAIQNYKIVETRHNLVIKNGFIYASAMDVAFGLYLPFMDTFYREISKQNANNVIAFDSSDKSLNRFLDFTKKDFLEISRLYTSKTSASKYEDMSLPDIEDLFKKKLVPACMFSALKIIETEGTTKHQHREAMVKCLKDTGYEKDVIIKYYEKKLNPKSEKIGERYQRVKQIEGHLKTIENINKRQMEANIEPPYGPYSKACQTIITSGNMKNHKESFGCPYESYEEKDLSSLMNEMGVDPETKHRVLSSKTLNCKDKCNYVTRRRVEVSKTMEAIKNGQQTQKICVEYPRTFRPYEVSLFLMKNFNNKN